VRVSLWNWTAKSAVKRTPTIHCVTSHILRIHKPSLSFTGTAVEADHTVCRFLPSKAVNKISSYNGLVEVSCLPNKAKVDVTFLNVRSLLLTYRGLKIASWTSGPENRSYRLPRWFLHPLPESIACLLWTHRRKHDMSRLSTLNFSLWSFSLPRTTPKHVHPFSLVETDNNVFSSPYPSRH
jgi:hypothetical protein